MEKTLTIHIEKFLLELGSGFAFVGRQYHLKLGKKDYYIDLLFYHLTLRCFIAIELKTIEFEPEHAGKMNFYLSVVDDHLKHSTDNPSIGLILCKTKDKIAAEYALKDIAKPIGLAEYKIIESLPEKLSTALPSIEELESKLAKDYMIFFKEISSATASRDLLHGLQHVILQSKGANNQKRYRYVL